MDIDLQIRAKEDPNFDQFLSSHQRQLGLEREAAFDSKDKKIREREAYEKIREEFSIYNRKRKKQWEERQIQNRNAYETKRATLLARENRDRKRFAAMQIRERENEIARQKALIAKMQSRLSRLPASMAVMQRKRTNKLHRESLYKRVLLEKRNSRR